MPDVGLVLQRAFEILEYVGKEKETSINRIASGLGIRPSSVSDYVRKLEQLGFLEVTVEKSMPPMKKVRLSKKGECLVKCL